MKKETAQKKLGFPALTAMVVGSMIGAGIFMLPARFAGASGVYGTLISWAIAGIGMLMLALVFQALAIRKPQLDTGVFAYAREGFGKYAGFVTAIGFWASACAGNVLYLVLIKSTLGAFIPALGAGDTIWAFLISSAVIWLFFVLIYKGVQQAAFVNTIATVAKIVPIVIFIGVLLFAFNPSLFVSNLHGLAGGEHTTLFSQITATMLLTVFAFLGIEGASVYSRYAKTRKMVGRSTILGFASVTALMILVSVLPFGILPQAEIAALQQPSMAGVFSALAGAPGGAFISIGLIVSVMGAYLAWTLMAAEVLFAASKSKEMPQFLRTTNKKNVPSNALLLSVAMTQLILIVTTFFSDHTLDLALDLTSALALLPFFLTSAFALKIALKRDGYEGVSAATRTKELVVASIASAYTLFLIVSIEVQAVMAGQWPKFIPLACLIIAPATVMFVRARRGQDSFVFSSREKVAFGALCAGAAIAVTGLATGFIVL
ncbi:MAG: basic amino acid/polyamine antiporter [Coriobacteriia bacterium]|nr:basic amino acid/polyamine antiporter [Coriobacteriia bacterium]